jgi:hypothetical protein
MDIEHRPRGSAQGGHERATISRVPDGRRLLVALACLAAVVGCGPTAPPDPSDPISASLCQMMPTVRQVRADVAEVLAAATADDLSAMSAAAERARSGAATLSSAAGTLNRSLSGPDARAAAIASMAIFGQQIWSATTAGRLDQRTINLMSAALREADAGIGDLVVQLRDRGFGEC